MTLTLQPRLRSPPPPNGADAAWNMVNQLLVLNHEKHHVYFHSVREVLMHNHLAHHALTLFSLGANAENIRSHFENHATYQKDKGTADVFLVYTISDFTTFKRHLGDPNQYHNFLEFFRLQFKNHGYKPAVNKLVFSGDDWSTEIFSRLVTGFIHPLIQAGFGLEFDLPFLVCEGLAMGCTQNDPDVALALLEVEECASRRPDHLSLVDILDLCAANKKLIDCLGNDPFHLMDYQGILSDSTREQVLDYASRYLVLEHEVEMRSAELCNATAYILAGAQRRGKEPRADFFLLHPTNCSVIMDSIVKKDWIGRPGKARLLSWFGRYTIMLYIGMGCPQLDLTHIRNYTPRKGPGGWIDAIERSLNYRDDGHGCKIIRALIHAQNVSCGFDDRPDFRMKKDDFAKAATALVESWLPNDQVQRAGHNTTEAWIRFAGFDQAWDAVPDLLPVQEQN
ncbi:HypA protein [Colletotrichum orchidophilum]|uniref:HypA protein n=1 Tax=Colletotrichum orchidophilum TaxID=1209926 RepID=A0A1G4BBE5_9PEZI|nr:HypA protein [Colletotrichum orchidophilum]OHE98665.1 HypA protein [Colletotrichum orchidophilum]